jgi:hypothetical protein
MVPVPEGQLIVICPYCDLRSFVRGERGLPRYQVPRQVDRLQAEQALRSFFSSHRAIAVDAARQASLQEAFLAYLPFWASWARALGWVFGQQRVRQGEHTTWKPREIRFAQEVSWNGAACDVGEFGVEAVPLQDQPFQPFDTEALHSSGMVFEPVGSSSQAATQADQDFQNRVGRSARLDRIAQVFTRFVRRRFGLVYYPLWVLRYLYRGRSFQVVVDGFSGQVLYGKAPGNTLYRAAMLVGGMALGAFLAVDASAIVFSIGLRMRGDEAGGVLLGGLALLAIGFGVMAAAYRSFRYGEQYEYRRQASGSSWLLGNAQDMLGSVRDLETWINRLS